MCDQSTQGKLTKLPLVYPGFTTSATNRPLNSYHFVTLSRNMPTSQELLQELTQLLSAQQELPKPTEGPYLEWINRKSNWVPAQYAPQELKVNPANTHKVLQRCLALALELEIPVGLYTLEASRREFTPEQKWALLDNATDEVTHYQALTNWVTSLTSGIPIQYLDEARQIREQIQEVPEHEVLKSGYVELGVFFVVLSLLRKFGGTTLKLLAQDISRDEAQHVLTNWSVIDHQGIPYSTSVLNGMRRDIVSWLVHDLRSSSYGPDFWLQQSDNLVATRSAEGLSFTKAGMYTAFFEVSNQSLAAY